MADDTSQSKGIKNKKKSSASRNNMGPSLGFDIDVELGSESQLSNLVEDQQRNHSIKSADSHIYSDNNPRSDILYSDNSVLSAARPMSSLVDSNIHRNQQGFAMARQGNAFSMAQSAGSLRLTPSLNLNQQHTNAFNASLNAAEAINNANISRVRSPMFAPDLNASLSNTNGYPYNYHPGFNPNFVPNLSQRANYNSFSLGEDNLLPLYTRGGEQYYGGQSILAEGMIGDAERMSDRSIGTMNNNISIVKRRRVEDIGVSDLSLSKRARNLAQQQQQLLSANSAGQLQWGNISDRSYSMYAEKDAKNLSQYQCLVRKQIEIFEAATVDARTNAQGRNRPILPGQIGIRCRHCYKLPLKERRTGSVYYPNTLVGVYQTAQKMTVGHLLKHCSMIPPAIREQLLFLKNQKSSDGGGKQYWADGVRALGVVETPNDGLQFAQP